jgi:hypothetical protein
MHRSTSSISRILGSLSDHPAVARVSWDVLMCAISLATWAAIRGIDVSRLVSAAGLTVTSSSSKPEEPSNGNVDASLRRKVRRRRKKSQTEGEAAKKDDGFTPSKAVAPIAFGEEEEDEKLETGAVSWAVFALGGLGVVASGVLGAEFET